MTDTTALENSSPIEEETDFESAFNEHATAKEDDAQLEPEPEPKPDEVISQDGESGDSDPAPAEEDDIYAGMGDEAKLQLQQLQESNTALQHKIDSDNGRVSAFQRKVNTLEVQIQDLREGDTAGKPSETQILDAMKGSDDGWNDFSEDYPEIAKMFDSRMEKMGEATQDALNSSLAPVKNDKL